MTRLLFLTAVISVKVLLISPLEHTQNTLWHVARPSITDCSKAHSTFAACVLSKLLFIVNSWSTFNEEINYQRHDRQLHSGSNFLNFFCKLTYDTFRQQALWFCNSSNRVLYTEGEDSNHLKIRPCYRMLEDFVFVQN